MEDISSQDRYKSQKRVGKDLILLIVIILAVLTYYFYQQGVFKPHPVIIETKQESLKTIAVWVKNDSPFPGYVKITVKFYKSGKFLTDTWEYVYLNGYEIKKVEITVPIKAVFSAEKYSVFARVV